MNASRVFVGLLIAAVAGRAQAVTPSEQELTAARQFAAAKLSGRPAELPFSFVYGGKSSRGLLGGWRSAVATERLDPARARKTLRWTDPVTGLEVRCEAIEYGDFPALEWTLFFRNTSGADSPVLEDVLALDAAWQRLGEGEFLLHHATGSQANRSDYAPRETPLPAKAVARFAGARGRPSGKDWPYFNLQWPGQGVLLAVGWPGQWAGEFVRDEGRGVRVRAGQELFRAKLRAGEEIRTPLVVVMPWQGDYARSQNLWRRWMMAHGMPRPGGRLPPPQFVASSSRAYAEMIKADCQTQIMHIDRYLAEGLKIDYWWMDAGWYVQQQGWPQVGTWEVDRKRFPGGLRPISDHAHSKGVKIIVWFEPERVAPGTWLYEKHPEWLLRRSPDQTHALAGMRSWSAGGLGSDPCVVFNPTAQTRSMANIQWEPGRLSFHPGPKGEYSVVRFTAPEAGEYTVQARFLAIDRSTTTDVHVRQGGRPVFDGFIGLHGQGKQATYEGTLAAAKGDMLDFVCGWGNAGHTCDSTGLEVRLKAPSGRTYDAAKEAHAESNPHGPWSYGYFKPGPLAQSTVFRLYDRAGKPGEEGARLLDLGNPAARTWLTEHVDRLLVSEGIDLYRQDFNIDPLAFWQAADTADRQGISENKYLCGYLAYWDELRRRHPNMLIDSCASGGRRNDLETMRRSVPLWRSDCAYEPIAQQSMTYGISLWLPYHGTGTVASSAAPYYGGGYTAVEPYAFWSNAAPSLGSGVDVRVREIDYNALRKLYGQWRELSRFYYADYYPLTPYTQNNHAWLAWQFHDPESGCGVIQAFRRAESPLAELRLKLHELDPAATYAVGPIGSAPTTTAGGRELIGEGLRVSLPEKPGAAVIVYMR